MGEEMSKVVSNIIWTIPRVVFLFKNNNFLVLLVHITNVPFSEFIF